MLEPNIITVIAPIREGAVEPLGDMLQNEFNPTLEGVRDFPFHALPGLHFCSFCIIDAVEDLPAYLVMEATFDGTREAFLDTLCARAAEPLARAFNHCIGFPRNGVSMRPLLRTYLNGWTLPHAIFFCGAPGMTRAQIEAEDRLHDTLRDHLSDQRRAGETPPAEHRAILHNFQQIARHNPVLSALDMPVRRPASVTGAPAIIRMVLILGVLATTATGLLVMTFSAISFADLREVIGATPLDHLFLQLIGVWAAARYLNAVVTLPDGPVLWRKAVINLCLLTTRIAAPVMGILASLIACRLAIGPQIAVITSPNALIIWIALGLAGLWGIYLRGSLARRIAVPGTAPQRIAMLQALSDICRHLWHAGGLIVLVPLYALIGMLMPPMVIGVIVDAIYLLLGLAAAAAIGGLVLVVLRILSLLAIMLIERTERGKWFPAEMLVTRGLGRAHVYAREEHGTNALQNHFASVTFVKPGWARQIILRIVLVVINFLARHVFNRGTLGGIPTILSARWILLDRGRRLLFLTNYVGAWDSYLNEFSELAAVSGVNAIWANTYVHLDPDQQTRFGASTCGVGFVETTLLTGAGGRNVPAFKAYVRQSQIQSRAWFSAYPHLNVPDIHANAALRRQLFATPGLAEIDDMLGKM